MKQFDKENVYDEQIAPLMEQIIAICNENGLSMFASYCIKNDEENGELYCTTCLPGDCQPDKFKDLYRMLQQGYVVTPPFFGAMTVTTK